MSDNQVLFSRLAQQKEQTWRSAMRSMLVSRQELLANGFAEEVADKLELGIANGTLEYYVENGSLLLRARTP